MDPCPENIHTYLSQITNKSFVVGCVSLSQKPEKQMVRSIHNIVYTCFDWTPEHQVKSSQEINIFQDVAFKSLKNVYDALFKKLHSKGIGTKAKATL